MVKQSSVRGAYVRTSDGNGRRAWFSPLVAVALGIVFLVILLSQNGGFSRKDNLRTNQMPVNMEEVYADLMEAAGNETVRLNTALVELEQRLQAAEDQELESDESVINESLADVGNKLRIGMGQLFGTKLDANEVDEIANEIQSELHEEAKSYLYEKAEGIEEDEYSLIVNKVERETQDGLTTRDIIGDVRIKTELATSEVKAKIHEVANSISESMQSKAQDLELKILEKRLSEKLHKTVKLTIVEDQIDGIDELLSGLTTLGGASSTRVVAPSDSDHPTLPGGQSYSAKSKWDGDDSGNDDSEDDEQGYDTDDDGKQSIRDEDDTD